MTQNLKNMRYSDKHGDIVRRDSIALSPLRGFASLANYHTLSPSHLLHLIACVQFLLEYGRKVSLDRQPKRMTVQKMRRQMLSRSICLATACSVFESLSAYKDHSFQIIAAGILTSSIPAATGSITTTNGGSNSIPCNYINVHTCTCVHVCNVYYVYTVYTVVKSLIGHMFDSRKQTGREGEGEILQQPIYFLRT